MAANSERKPKSETMLEVIRGLVLDFALYFALYFDSALYHMTKYSLYIT